MLVLVKELFAVTDLQAHPVHVTDTVVTPYFQKENNIFLYCVRFYNTNSYVF